MKEKVKCKKCGLFIDSDLEICPYCGYPQKIEEESNNKDNSSSTDSVSIEKERKDKKEENKVKFFDFESRTLKVSTFKSGLFLIIGLLLLNLLATVLQLIAINSGSWYFLTSIAFNASINFSIYFIITGAMFLTLNKDTLTYFKEFKDKWTWIYGLAFGFLLMIASSAVSSLMQLIRNTGVNANEAGIDTITSAYPFLSIIVFGLLGPIAEEFTYRAGLFNLLRKISRPLAYFGTAIIFGLIHFSFNPTTIIDELINLPSYIVSGLLLSYFYEYKGIGASTVAHMTNNLFAVIMQVILSLA